MQRALVIGGSGSFGGAVARELLRRGWHVRALRREQGRPLALDGAVAVTGDALQPEDVLRAAEGVDVIVHGYNTPYWHWAKTLLPAARAVARAAAVQRARIVFPGNVYGLGPNFEHPLVEGSPRQARTRKGKLRNAVEAELEHATADGARWLNIRCGDYFGPSLPNTWFQHMTEKALRGGALIDPGRAGVLHEWAYLPDVARATVDLLERGDELGSSETFHMSSHQLTSSQLLEAINRELDAPRRIRRMPWRLMRWLSPFSPMLRELSEMKYLWDEPVLLDDAKLRQFLGHVHRTPLNQAVRAALGLEGTGLRDVAARVSGGRIAMSDTR